MIDLLDVTFVISCRIESSDREFNFRKVIQYLCDNFYTNIFIKEVDSIARAENLLLLINTQGCDVQYFFEVDNSNSWHRPRYINELLHKVKTQITCVYDYDCLFYPEAYVYARNRIKDGCDLVYPYMDDPSKGQVRINFPDKSDFTSDLFNSKYHELAGAKCGFAQFFNTKSYRDGGMENENFQSYCPDDVERMQRFIKLGSKVEWSPFQCFHIEHSRGINSLPNNPHFTNGQALCHQLGNMSKQQLIEYYNSQEYLKKYQ